MSGAGEVLQQAAVEALRTIDGLGVYDAAPVQAVVPYAVIEAGPETDWSHKSGLGRELRLAVTVRDAGERPVRLRQMVSAVEAAVGQLSNQLPGWQVVTLQYLKSRTLPARARGEPWVAVIEYRARMLAD